MVKKSLHFIFIPVLAALVILYVVFNDVIHSCFFTLLESSVPSKVSMEKIVFVEGDFSIEDYGKVTDRIKGLDNSTALFLPQVFNIKINEYLENINPARINNMKNDYKNFIIKLSEAQNIIPVVFLSRNGQQQSSADPSGFRYFDAKSFGPYLPVYNYAKIAGRQAWQSATNAGFYEEYNYYPYRIPAVFNYRGSVLAGAPVEAVRKYYKLTRNRVTMSGNSLNVGDIISFPLQQNGTIMVHRFMGKTDTYTPQQFLDAPVEKINDKIIIVRSSDIPDDITQSIGVAAQSILRNSYIKYDPMMNYIAAAVIFVLLFTAYRPLKLRFGLPVFIITAAALYYGCAELLANNIYADFPLLMAANLAAFSTFYFYSVTGGVLDRNRRRAIFAPVMHPQAVKKFISRNRDIKIKNNWAKAYVMYINFDSTVPMDAQSIKKTFEKVEDAVYTIISDFIIKCRNNSDLALVFSAEDAQLSHAVRAAIELRDKLRDLKFNIILNITETYIFDNSGEIGFIDRKYNLTEPAKTVEKKKYIIVPEADIQNYVNTARFQKIYEKAGVVLFNIAGIREEAVDEN